MCVFVVVVVAIVVVCCFPFCFLFICLFVCCFFKTGFSETFAILSFIWYGYVVVQKTLKPDMKWVLNRNTVISQAAPFARGVERLITKSSQCQTDQNGPLPFFVVKWVPTKVNNESRQGFSVEWNKLHSLSTIIAAACENNNIVWNMFTTISSFRSKQHSLKYVHDCKQFPIQTSNVYTFLNTHLFCKIKW